ncbi:hypothetical protein B566_EDAN002481 [Ephemera danica]|nr:hypothetical protein B566_EDAN002481 [Ephemera danica]
MSYTVCTLCHFSAFILEFLDHMLSLLIKKMESSLLPIHKKPSYYQRVGDTSKTALALNESVTLHNGDMFYMIESGCGYRVQISGSSLHAEEETDDPPVEETASGHTAEEIPQSKKSPGKRKFPQWMVEEEEEAPPVSPKKTVEKPASSESGISPEPEDLVETETLEENVASPTKVSAPHDMSDEDGTGSLTVAGVDGSEETGGGEDEDDAQQGTSANPPQATAQPQRQSCKYGQSCYRKNPQHRLDFSHPGDADFVVVTAPAPGSKPACPYGSNCYRKNPQHIQDYDHTQPPTATSPAKQGRKKRKAAGQKKNTGHYSGSDSNESYESSFIGSSDEYNPDPNDDDDTDEDWD